MVNLCEEGKSGKYCKDFIDQHFNYYNALIIINLFKTDKVTELTPAMKYVPLHFRNITRIKEPGRLGNKMFQYATLLAIAKQNNMTVFLTPNYQSLFRKLQHAFNLSNHPNVPLNIITKTYLTFREFIVETMTIEHWISQKDQCITKMSFFMAFTSLSNILTSSKRK